MEIITTQSKPKSKNERTMATQSDMCKKGFMAGAKRLHKCQAEMQKKLNRKKTNAGAHMTKVKMLLVDFFHLSAAAN